MCTEVGDSLNKPIEGFLGVYCEKKPKTYIPGITNSGYNELSSGSLQSSIYRDSTVIPLTF